MTKEEIINLLETEYLSGNIDIKDVKRQLGFNINLSSDKVFTELGIYNEFKKIQNKRRGLSAKKTNLKKYGVANGHTNSVKEKIKQTCINKYGTESSWQSDIIKNKSKQTKLYKYGNENFTNRDKCKQTMQKTYGVDNCSQLDDWVDKVKQTKLDKYKDENYNNSTKMRKTKVSKISTYMKENNCLLVSDLVDIYGSGWRNANIVNIIIYNDVAFVKCSDLDKIIKYATKINPNAGISHKEKELVDFIKTFYDKSILENKRKIIYPQELDIYLPDLHIGIEFNGTYWHSVERDTPKSYHLDKSLLCREKNIRLIHIYEFEDFEQQKQLLKDLILGQDNYPKNDFNKNNLIDIIPKPEIIYKDNYNTIYGAGKLK